MKFKSIFWLFNIVVAAALVVFAVASFFLFGREYAAIYWGNMWVVAVLFLLLIIVLDFYFIRNWKLFDLLEKEDWPALLAWLENNLYVKGRLRRSYANLLINTALSVANFDAVKKLEAEVRQKKSGLLPRLGVSLGIPYLQERDWDAVARHYGPLADDPKTHRRDWARWCRAMAAGEDGLSELFELLESRDPSIGLLAFQTLGQHSGNLSGDQKSTLDDAEARLKASMAGESGDRALQRSREDHLMAVVLTAPVNGARQSLMGTAG